MGPARVPRPLPSPHLILVGGFAILIVVGCLLLLLPAATAPGQTTSVLDAFFTATSAVCVTGLIVVDTGTHWSGFGQAVILVLIQLGGLGFMTASTILFLLLGRRTSLRDRLLLREALGGIALRDVLRLVWQIAALTLAIEAAGIVVFFVRFLREAPSGSALWWAVFHAVSAFNNAGFDVFGGFRSLVPYRGDAYVLVNTAVLIILGGFSFTFLADVLRTRSFDKLTLDSKLVLVSNLGLLALGTVAFFLAERGNIRSTGAVAPPTQLLDAFFLSASARTAGYNALDLAQLQDQSLFMMMALMFVGTASGSTGGGIKVNTLAVLLLAVWSTVVGRPRVEAFGRELPQEQVHRALAVAFLAVALIFAVALGLAVFESAPFLPLIFEAVSAFGTAGLTLGVTPTLSEPGRLLVAFLMFVGRLGPLTFVLSLARREQRLSYRFPLEEIKIG